MPRCQYAVLSSDRSPQYKKSFGCCYRNTDQCLLVSTSFCSYHSNHQQSKSGSAKTILVTKSQNQTARYWAHAPGENLIIGDDYMDYLYQLMTLAGCKSYHKGWLIRNWTINISGTSTQHIVAIGTFLQLIIIGHISLEGNDLRDCHSKILYRQDHHHHHKYMCLLLSGTKNIGATTVPSLKKW